MVEKKSMLTVNVSVTDTEIFKGMLEVMVELAHQLDDEQSRYFVDKMNGILGEDCFDIEYKEEAEMSNDKVTMKDLLETWEKELGYNKSVLLSCCYPVLQVVDMTDEDAEAEVEAIGYGV